ncbi:11757_t:CDS:2, partial [Entrophospora sp. SA101]
MEEETKEFNNLVQEIKINDPTKKTYADTLNEWVDGYIVFREYFIRLNNRSNIITLAYCLWCGDKLPTSLRENYFDILEKEHGIETNLGEYKERSDIPANFRTD